MAQTLMRISNVLLVLALLCIAATVIVSFKFKIRDVIAELTGKSARKSIEQLREDNKKSGIKRFRVLDRTGTDQVSVIKPETGAAVAPTEPLPGETLQKVKNMRASTEPLESEKHDSYRETTAMGDGSDYLETSYMEQDDYQETGLMQDASKIAGAGNKDYDETSILEETLQDPSIAENEEKGNTVPLNKELKILQDIVLIHTNEEIR